MGKKLIETTQDPPHYCDVAYLEHLTGRVEETYFKIKNHWMYGSGLRLKSIGLYEAKKRPKDRKASSRKLCGFLYV
ncbi:hypothetical protein FB592_2546 [Bacillus sp. SJZ110]|nr:hypothetical protein FB592_2546 [Bacillus sp. SJZ110]CUB32849.1 hypothetical protein BN2127_JRS6_02722 [Bacillus subtilis]